MISRTELKYLIRPEQAMYFDNWLLCKSRAIKIYPDRIINSIYYDDFSYSSITDNLSGISNRTKIRIRWYGSENNSFVQIELKKKKNRFSYKETIKTNKKISDISIKDFLSLDNLIKMGCPKIFIEEFSNKKLTPVLQVRYIRSYYYLFNLELNYDQNISYLSFSDTNQKFINDEFKVMEIKMKNNVNPQENRYLADLNISRSRNSKLIRGMSFIGRAAYV